MPERLSAMDALLWRLGHDASLSPITLWLQVYEGDLDRDRYAGKLQESLGFVPNLAKRIVAHDWLPRLPYWENDPSFDFANHVQHLPAPGDGSMAALVRTIQPVLTLPWGQGRSPWDERVFQGVDGGRTVIVRRQHHVLTDGLRWVRMMEQLVDDSPGGRTQTRSGGATSAAIAPEPGAGSRALAHPVATTRRCVSAFRRMLAPLGGRPLSPVMTSRSRTFAFDFMPIELHALRAGARAAGGSINDGFLAGVATGVRRYHEKHDGASDPIRTTIAVGLPGDEEQVAGNDVAAVIIPMPLGPDAASLVPVIGSRVRDGVADTDVIRLMTLLPEISSRAPRVLMWPILKHQVRGFDLIASNMRGLQRPYWMAGARHLYTAVTNTPGGAAANLILQSSLEATWLGVSVDTGAIPDRETFMDCIRQGLEEVAKLA